MKTIVEQLSQYALYHRDQRNIYTHYIGIPMIVIAVMGLCWLPLFSLASVGSVTLTHLLLLLLCGYYLRLHVPLGLVMVALLAIGAWLLQVLVAQTGELLWTSVTLFVVGWVFQFVGHYFEGKKPAFIDDLMGLAIGPLFVAAEWAFSLGCFSRLKQQIEQIAGPTR